MNKAFLLSVLIISFGCGIKGPPLPPLETVNDRANNVNADSASSADISGAKTKTISGDGTTIKKDISK